MKFKKLEVAGFKSFADRLEIKFGAGVTAIVGPNGCGKSNVADSIRWVLGEQSAKLLRGSSMQDVIFNGTENRKSLSYCEVNLYFDNTERIFPSLDYNEVVITRKLYRSGESEYCLNKTPCRLKDITELLRDGGMGREGYSIIGQGRIDELLSAKPEDRRAIFEEAAGISKFKAKKIESERKLARTRDNMVKVDLIMEEIGKQLEPLSRQAESARKWLALRDTLKNLEINTYIYQYDSASQAKEIIGERLRGVNENIALRQQEWEKANTSYNEAMHAVGNTDREIEALREELMSLSVGLEKQAGEIKLFNERLNYLNAQNERLSEETAQLNTDKEQTEQFIEIGTTHVNQLAWDISAQREKVDKCNEEYLAVVDTLTKSQGEVDSTHRNLIEAMEKLADIRSNMSRMLAEREALNVSTAELKRRILALKEKNEEDTSTTDALKADLDETSKSKNELTKTIDELLARISQYQAKINETAVQIDKISASFYTEKSRHKMFVDMRNSQEGFAFSVKKLLSESQNNAQLSTRIEGVVAKLVKVNEGFETAIEMALGNAVQNVVVENEEDAKYLIDYLKQNKLGRVTFLPITSVKPRVIEKEYLPLLNAKGVFGIADTLISFDKKYEKVFSSLLGGTVIVDNMDTAVQLAKKARYGFKIVTLDGDVINPQGSITGGSKRSELTNVFGYDKEIQKAEQTLKELTQKLNELNAQRDEANSAQNEVAEKSRALREKMHGIDIEFATKSEVYNKLSTSVATTNEEINALQSEYDVATARIDAITRDIDSVGALESMVQSAKEQAGESGDTQRALFDELRKERDFKHEEMTSARLKLSELENESANANNDLTRLKNSLDVINEKIAYNESQRAENDRLISSIDASLRDVTTSAGANDTERITEIRGKLANLDAYKQERQLAVSSFDTRRVQLMNELNDLTEKRSREELQLAKVDSDIEQMQIRVEEEYQLDYEGCLPFKQEDYDLNKGIAEAAKVKRQMNSLGNINLGAIDESKEVFERYHDLEVQREDLVRAEQDLVQIIKELSDEMLSRFEGQFEKIRENFVKIFKELFDGGKADLVMLENENPLEAGIEIVAQPPQKKLGSISLLSGGERALTAIAILFAILRLKPMPFCVLDEIEAALDDANAGRFAKYLRRFSEETQFIVITHRKPTMELADSLYGVTMEEKGVSKIVSVKLSDAIALDEGQTA